MPSHVKFVEVNLRDGRKTKVWAVLSLDGRCVLGRIAWYAPWRRYVYVFQPNLGQVILDVECMGEITGFIKLAMLDRKWQRANAERADAGKGKSA